MQRWAAHEVGDGAGDVAGSAVRSCDRAIRGPTPVTSVSKEKEHLRRQGRAEGANAKPQLLIADIRMTEVGLSRGRAPHGECALPSTPNAHLARIASNKAPALAGVGIDGRVSSV